MLTSLVGGIVAKPGDNKPVALTKRGVGRRHAKNGDGEPPASPSQPFNIAKPRPSGLPVCAVVEWMRECPVLVETRLTAIAQ